ncbi:hypothetical protein V6N13_096397 [Hibiscus sabdariffa]
MAFNNKPKKLHLIFHFNAFATLLFILVFTVPLLFIILHTSTSSLCTSCVSDNLKAWSGDLRDAQFAWNRLPFLRIRSPPVVLKIAVFFTEMANWHRSWRHGVPCLQQYNLHLALARRGHRVHVFTSPLVNRDHPGTRVQHFPIPLEFISMKVKRVSGDTTKLGSSSMKRTSVNRSMSSIRKACGSSSSVGSQS